MQFNLKSKEVEDLLEKALPTVGDVYFAKGGRAPRLHIIIAQKGPTSYYVNIDDDGNICGASSYYTSVFAERTRIGKVEGLDELTFDVNWEPQ